MIHSFMPTNINMQSALSQCTGAHMHTNVHHNCMHSLYSLHNHDYICQQAIAKYSTLQLTNAFAHINTQTKDVYCGISLGVVSCHCVNCACSIHATLSLHSVIKLVYH